METILRRLGLQDYETVWRDMQRFTLERNQDTADEIWILEHPPVYTLGLNGKREHILSAGNIPIIQSDRGGQVTFHGPGQLVVYILLDIKRLKKGIREIVTMIEQAMIISLSQYGIAATAKPEAPGVYVNGKKIGSVGLRVKRGCCYHGLSLNNNMNLTSFNHINTCGYPSLDVTQLIDLDLNIKTHELALPVVHQILRAINQ